MSDSRTQQPKTSETGAGPLIAVAPARALLPSGCHPATLVAITEEYSTTYKSQYRRWEFEIPQPNGARVRQAAFTSTAFGPEAKGRRYATVLLGRDILPGEELDLTTLIGKSVELVLGVEDRPDGTQRNTVEEVRPLPETAS
jgi:hypothetical protein